jgi:hypothetical protein
MVGTTSGVTVKKNGDDVDINLYKGKTVNFSIFWKDSQNQPIDISSYTAKMQVRQNLQDAVLLEFSTANSRININGLTGEINITMPAIETANLAELVDGIYDLEIESPLGDVSLVMSGMFNIIGEVTR